MVKIELRRKILRRIKKGYNQTVLRRIEQYINTWFRLMKDLVKYEEENYPEFVYLVEDIERITDYNRNDAIIVANALVWSYTRDLDNPKLRMRKGDASLSDLMSQLVYCVAKVSNRGDKIFLSR